ncbi:P-loop NTPase [Galactobacter sp.]|uniref:Mrp/NBP35 family ATP-binding protein n=1 Tax=Galactobacter sp. TaxID=2676125 RepID=UPI0025B986C6|nr:P-loop NTPase [Galactobacter sp.]
MTATVVSAVEAAMERVIDPELRRPITELGMLDSVEETSPGTVSVAVSLTVQGCPLRGTIEEDVRTAALGVDGVSDVSVQVGYMDPERRRALVDSLKRHSISFTEPGSLTRVIAVASGKGGVGKSSVTVNLAAAMAADGLSVGVVDADVLGFSVPGLMGVHTRPTRVDEMILPPVAHGVKVVSIGMFLEDNAPVMWRGPMLHRALEQFLTDVHFGDLDVLLLDLPPGTGDVAISVSQLLPHAEVVVVTTPQSAAAQVAERAGTAAHRTGQKVLGVVENMSWIELPDGTRMTPFGEGGGAALAQRLSEETGESVSLLARIPLDPSLREGGDQGTPVVLSHPDSAASKALTKLAARLAHRPRGLAGRQLGITPR